MIHKYNHFPREHGSSYTFQERRVLVRASLHVGYGFYLGQYTKSMRFGVDNPGRRSEPVFDLAVQIVPAASSGGRSAIGVEAMLHISAPAARPHFVQGVQFDNVTGAYRGYNLFLGVGYTRIFTPRNPRLRHSVDIYPGFTCFFQDFYVKPRGYDPVVYKTTGYGVGLRLAYGLRYKLADSHALELKAGLLVAAKTDGRVVLERIELQKLKKSVNASLLSLTVGYAFGRN